MFFLLLACIGAAVIEGVQPEDSGQNTGGDDTGTDDTGDPKDTGQAPPPDYDCSALPEVYTSVEVEGAKAYHGVAFDAQGRLVGWDSRNALTTSVYGEKATPWIPGMQQVEQIAEHPDGNFYVLASNSLWRVSPEGGQERILGGLYYAYGLTFAPDGQLWVADGGLHRVDIDSGEKVTVIEAPKVDDWSAVLIRDVAFSLDSTRMYVVSTSRSMQYWELDEDLNLVGERQDFINVPGGWKDGLEIDACGYFWLPDFQRTALFRVSPDGEETIRVMGGSGEKDYPHALSWGTGGDWSRTALYLPMPYDSARVRELEIGVPDGAEVRTWKGEKSRF